MPARNNCPCDCANRASVGSPSAKENCEKQVKLSSIITVFDTFGCGVNTKVVYMKQYPHLSLNIAFKHKHEMHLPISRLSVTPVAKTQSLDRTDWTRHVMSACTLEQQSNCKLQTNPHYAFCPLKSFEGLRATCTAVNKHHVCFGEWQICIEEIKH